MPKKAKTEKEETFNWKGIKDNGDGTFTVSDKRAKNRLQKEFRRQGVRSRSQKTGIKGFVVYPVGQRKQRAIGRSRMPRKELQRYPGYKPRTRYRVPGPRPQLRPGRPMVRGRPVIGGGGRPVFRGPGRREGIPQAIMKAADKRAQKVREKQVSPYTPEGKPRPGYQTYIDKTGTQRIVKMPTGTWRDRFMSKQQKEMVKQARVQESREIEKGMAERSKGQPSTRISEPHRVPGGVIRQKPAPAGVKRTTELPQERRERRAEPITSSGVRRTTELPEHKPDYQKMQHERAEAMERFSKIKLGEHEE